MSSARFDQIVAPSTSGSKGGPNTVGPDDGAAALGLFSVLWALAALWHLLGNVSGSWDLPHLALMAGVGAVLVWPGKVLPLAGLAVAGLWSAWAEAPMLSNHWLLAAFVNLAVLLSAALVVVARRRGTTGSFPRLLLPTARASLIAFYLFASFSKLNADFFDRAVSCAPYYLAESTNSIGLGNLGLVRWGWVQTAVIVGTAAIELVIPWLLMVRRTRHLGVVVALAFHGVLAIDRAHEFFDFSSLLSALFVLFLPAGFALWLSRGLTTGGRQVAERLATRPIALRAMLAGLVTVLGLAVELRVPTIRQARDIGWWLWQPAILVLVVSVVTYLWRERPAPVSAPLRLAPGAGILALVPLLVVLNGLTPYLELKTGYGWNMYANLHTVDGDSNHFIIRRTLPLTSQQAHLVRIVRSDDPGLQYYADHDFALTWDQTRSYLSRHRTVGLTYERRGRTVTLAHAEDDPAIVAPVPVWREKLLLFRAVDLTSPERCLVSWGPAR